MSGSATIWIAVSPEVAYAALTDLPRMGEWSPENRGGEWIGGDGGLGAIFRGRNGDAPGGWETVVTVIEAEPCSRFAFCVDAGGDVGTIWRYAFRPDRDGTEVRESFEWSWTPVPDHGFRSRVGQLPIDLAAQLVGERERDLRAQLDQTLAALKQSLSP